ncbi:MAG: hypothetical protein QRY72_05635 [Candidatus Rhabdochlamydia sp.]
MPMSAIQRAEKILLNICFDLRILQVNSLSVQSKLAKDTQSVFESKISHSKQKVGIDLLTLVGLVAGAWNSDKLEKCNINFTTYQTLVNHASNGINGLYTHPQELSHDMNMSKVSAQSDENRTWTSGVQSILQTYERALDQLHNIENNVRS